MPGRRRHMLHVLLFEAPQKFRLQKSDLVHMSDVRFRKLSRYTDNAINTRATRRRKKSSQPSSPERWGAAPAARPGGKP